MSDRLVTDAFVHDFTRQYWGHGLHNLKIDPKALTGKCLAHSRRTIRAGDHIRFKTGYGFATCEVTAATWCVDPDDMYRLEVRLIFREVTNPEAKGQVPEGPVGKGFIARMRHRRGR